MSDDLSVVGLLVSLGLPWICGASWMYWLLGLTGRRNLFMVLGQGYFVGIFATTLVLRLWDTAGLALQFWGVAALISALCLLGLALQTLRPAAVLPRVSAAPTTPLWQIALATILILLIGWRHLTMAQELLVRPLFAWDAWMNWAPKAVVWFHQGSLVDFVSAEQWLQQPSAEAYTLGNRRASLYPITVPLIQLWSMLGLGTWDHGAVYLSWVIASLALGMGLYGHLRLAGVSMLGAVIACYFLLSMPYLNVHSVMAGYADIWLASAFSLAVCALYEWRHSQHWVHTLLVLFLAVACMQLKNPGLVLGLILMLCSLWAWLDVRPRVALALLGALILLLGLGSTVGISGRLPYLGEVALQAGTINAGRLGQFTLAYHAVGSAFVGTFFEQINWHLLWYLLPSMLLLSVYRRPHWRMPPAEWLAVIIALLFVVLVFVYTKHYKAAVNFVTLNRALLYPIPALVFCAFVSLCKPDATSRYRGSRSAGD